MAKDILVTPAGKAEWAKVIEPGEAYERENPPEWTIDLVLDPGNNPADLAFITQIEDWYREMHGPKAPAAERGWPFRDHTDADRKPTGKAVVRFKRNTISRRGNPVPAPVIVDSKKRPWDPQLLIGNGSLVKVGFTYFGWERKSRYGISLDLAAVQVIDLVPYERPDPTGGFGEEDGYEVPEAQGASAFKEEEPPAAAPRRSWGAPPAPAPDDDEEIPF